MHKFEYAQANSVSEATRLLSDEPNSLVLAGGTAVVVLLGLGLLRPRLVLDIGAVPELQAKGETISGYRLGALTNVRTLETDRDVNTLYPMLAEAASQVGSVRVRNAATVGGAVAYGEPQTDLPVALVALSATLDIVSGTHQRTLPLEDFFHGPYETDLAMGEIVTGVSLPPAEGRVGGCHFKFTIGSIEHKPVANASIMVKLSTSGVCEDARIVAGAVGPTPLVAGEAADVLRGGKLSDVDIKEAARLASDAADPIEDLRGSVWYKRRIVKSLVERGLRCAMLRAKATG